LVLSHLGMFHIRHGAVSQPLCAGALSSIAGRRRSLGGSGGPHASSCGGDPRRAAPRPWQSGENTAPREGLVVMATRSRVLSPLPWASPPSRWSQGTSQPTETHGAGGASSSGRGSELDHWGFPASLAKTVQLLERPVPGNGRGSGPGVRLRQGLPRPRPWRAALRASRLRRWISSPLLCSYFPSPPNDSMTMLNCVYGACAVSRDYGVVSVEGAARGERTPAGSWAGSRAPGGQSERAGDSREIFTFNFLASFPSKSADIWKRGIIAICSFQQVPPLPCAAPGSARLCQRPQHGRGHRREEEEGERTPSPPGRDGPVAPSDARRPRAMPRGGTRAPLHPIRAGTAGEAPDSILLTAENLK